jgi:hypothetical protein
MSTSPCTCAKPRVIGTEVRGFYDGVAYWQCRGCGLIWDRFGSQHMSAATIPHPVMGNKKLLGDFKS